MKIHEAEPRQVPWINEDFLQPALMGPSRHREEGSMVLLSEILADHPVYPVDIILYIAQHACRGLAMGGARQFMVMLDNCRPAVSAEQLQILFEVLHDGYEVIKERGEQDHKYASTYSKLMRYVTERLRTTGKSVPDCGKHRRSISLILSPQIILR